MKARPKRTLCPLSDFRRSGSRVPKKIWQFVHSIFLELFRIDRLKLHTPIGMRLQGQGSLYLFSFDAELRNFYICGVPDLEMLADTLSDCRLRERGRRSLTAIVKA